MSTLDDKEAAAEAMADEMWDALKSERSLAKAHEATIIELGDCIDTLTRELARLRERDAAWTWLAVKGYHLCKVAENTFEAWEDVAGDEDRDSGIERCVDVNGQPIPAADPVALATALDKDWRVK